jgi:hypothetical protein
MQTSSRKVLKNVAKNQLCEICIVTVLSLYSNKSKPFTLRNYASEVCKDLDFSEPIPSSVNDGIVIITNTRYGHQVQSLCV